MVHKNKEDRNRYMREYRARQREKKASLERKDGIIRITNAETLGQFLMEDMEFDSLSLNGLVDQLKRDGNYERMKDITVYFKIPVDFLIAIPNYA